jgi:FHS family L-fucose permease-like MFS transporter
METENVQTKWPIHFIDNCILLGFVGSANDILIPVLKSIYIVPTSVAISGLGILCRLLYWIHHFFFLVLKEIFYKNLDIKKTLSAGLLLSAVGSFLLFCYYGMEFSFFSCFIYRRIRFFNTNCS